MKRLTTCLVSLSLGCVLFAQAKLTYENHALLSGANNTMTYCEYQEPGSAGESIWDFSQLKEVKQFTGLVSDVSEDEFLVTANTQLEEFGSKFLFDVSEQGMNQVGYASSDSKTIIRYIEPFNKLVFPFAYGDSYTTDFYGDYLYKSNKIADVTGDGTVEADAWGTLKLPNDKVFENTLRVKTSKNYTVEYSETKSSKVEITTYRWYMESHRYPLVVLTEVSKTSGKSVSTNYQAAYNNDVVNPKSTSSLASITLNDAIKVFPNPSSTELFVELESENGNPVYTSVYDVTGKLMVAEKRTVLTAGLNKIDLSEEVSMLKSGTYILNIRNENQLLSSQEISISK